MSPVSAVCIDGLHVVAPPSGGVPVATVAEHDAVTVLGIESSTDTVALYVPIAGYVATATLDAPLTFVPDHRYV